MVIISQKLFTGRACASIRLRHLCILHITGDAEEGEKKGTGAIKSEI